MGNKESVNNAFNCAKEQHDDWIQSVEYYLDMNGYADMFMNPTRYTPVESKILICNRTNDEYTIIQLYLNQNDLKLLKSYRNCYKIFTYCQKSLHKKSNYYILFM